MAHLDEVFFEAIEGHLVGKLLVVKISIEGAVAMIR
jgi:hypothetical protein